MRSRFTDADVEAWRRDGGVLIPSFFTPDEVAAVQRDFERLFEQGRSTGAAAGKKQGEQLFDDSQFAFSGPIPYDCSPALNLIGVHPQLVELARKALESDDVLVYQCMVMAKFTGYTNYDQPLHCDWRGHTLTVPGDEQRFDAMTIICYFSDVSEQHGPMRYVPRSESRALVGPDANLEPGGDLARGLATRERSTASSAGSIFPFAMDLYHRGTDLTAPGGHRYAVFVSFKTPASHALGFHAWPYYETRPWRQIFDHATPEQLACFGVPRPGDAFWTEATLARMRRRYPGWNDAPYRDALGASGASGRCQ